MNNSNSELTKFAKDRGLDKKPFEVKTESINILEELFEAQGLHNRTSARLIFRLMSIITFFFKLFKSKGYKKPTEESIVDAFADVRVFAHGAHLKQGYEPEKVLLETAKEINSRCGQIIDGKFTKFRDPVSVAKWYKADYSGCKL